MIKRIIFDVDDTLIDFLDIYWKSISNAFSDYGIHLTELEEQKILGIYNEYEKNNIHFDINRLFKIVQKKMNKELPDGLTNKILYYFSNCVPSSIDKEIIETMEYLSLKYELVVLSNFYTDVQKSRLQKVGLLKYFDKIYGYDTNCFKPEENSYKISSNGRDYGECVFVGDNYVHDYLTPLKIGMKAFLLDKNDKYNVDNKIYKISDLKKYL